MSWNGLLISHFAAVRLSFCNIREAHASFDIHKFIFVIDKLFLFEIAYGMEEVCVQYASSATIIRNR